METIADVNPRLLRAFDLTLLILLCVLYFVRVEIVRHQWYVEALMLSLGVLTESHDTSSTELTIFSNRTCRYHKDERT